MIAAIGTDRTTPAATRSAPSTSGTTGFAAAFEAMTAPVPSFTITRPAPQRMSEREAAASAEADRLDQAVAAFKQELSLTPAERVRRDVLKSMDLTEDAIEALPPKERVEAEQKVAMEVARRMKILQGGSTATGPSADGIG